MCNFQIFHWKVVNLYFLPGSTFLSPFLALSNLKNSFKSTTQKFRWNFLQHSKDNTHSNMHDKWPSSSIADSNFVLGNAQVPPAYPIVYCSDGFCELTGYTRAQIMQKGCACKFLFGSETEKGQIGEITKALQDKTELKLELQLYKKNGKSFLIDWLFQFSMFIFDNFESVLFHPQF